jgi:Kef-type K+ transport system membrane component KefB
VGLPGPSGPAKLGGLDVPSATSVAAVLAVVLAAALVIPLVSERVRVPGIVALIVTGTLLGPNVLGVVEPSGLVGLLGALGLLYLMFLAGLELDLGVLFGRRGEVATLGALTFAIPMAVGCVVLLVVGYPLLSAVLIGSAFASHTIVAFPEFHRTGSVASRAVTTALGATIVAVIGALVVLVAVLRIASNTNGLLAVWLPIVTGLGVVFGAGFLLPKATSAAFRLVRDHRGGRFAYAMVVLFLCVGLAEAFGLDGIIGAFVAGLGLNRNIPRGSATMDGIETLGTTLLIPIFLLTVGMIVDPGLVGSWPVAVLAGIFAAIAIGTKLIAAGATAPLFGYARDEVGAVFSLTSAQAAATLAAVVLGVRAGLIDQATVNAVVVVVLVTCVVASWVGARVAPRLRRPHTIRPLVPGNGGRP